MLDLKTFFGKEQGPKFLVLGGVHGDETCGPCAINKLIKRLEEGTLKLSAGSLTFIPVCNPIAYERGVRFNEVNLNRVICKHDFPCAYEEFLANELTGYIDECDYLLDLHSITAKGQPFVFQDYQTKNYRSFVESLGVYNIIVGWPEMYESKDDQSLNSGDTVSYAYQKGKVAAVVECGQHTDPLAVDTATQSILNACSFLNLIEETHPRTKVFSRIRAAQIIIKEKEGSFVKEWQHLDCVNKGDIVLHYKNGEVLCAPYTGYILLPKANAKIGEEWFYFGNEI